MDFFGGPSSWILKTYGWELEVGIGSCSLYLIVSILETNWGRFEKN